MSAPFSDFRILTRVDNGLNSSKVFQNKVYFDLRLVAEPFEG